MKACWARRAVVLSLLAARTHSFPTADNLAKLALRDDSVTALDQLHELLVRHKQKRLLFDPLKHPIDVVSEEHAFQPPGPDDQRGPCPGMNLLANHKFINHNGVATVTEVILAANTVLGMSIELVTIIAIMGLIGVGNPLSLTPGFSIDGADPRSENLLGNALGLLGEPQGLRGSHNWIEADSSLTRDDLFLTGDSSSLNMTLWKRIYDSIDGALSMDDLARIAAERYHESVATNGDFYYGPFTGTINRNAGYLFAGRILSNHSAEYPQGGHMTKEAFASIFGVVEENGRLVYRRGHERLPANWYRIAVDYGLVELNLDLVNWLLQYPVLANIGGNLGKPNTFTGVDIEHITGGVLNAKSLLEGNNLLCFALHVVKTFAPNSLSTLFKTVEKPLQLLSDALLGPILSLACPEFRALTMGGTDLETGLFSKYPGAKQAGAAL